MTALSTDIKTFLTTGSVSNVYRGSKPAEPDNIVVISHSGGYARSMSGTMVEEPTFQIIVRNTTFDTAETLCNTIKDLLHGKNSTRILAIMQQGDINYLGRDQKNRHEFSLNFRCYYRR